MSAETWHPGRGLAADHGWRLEQLTYAALSSIYDPKFIARQFSSSSLRCHVDILLSHKNVRYAIFCTTGEEIDSPTRNSQYPAWETFDELKEIKLSRILGPKCIAVNIVFGNKKYWAKWLLSGKEVLFDSVFYPQYQKKDDFFILEEDLKYLHNKWKEERPEGPFYKYIQSRFERPGPDLKNVRWAYNNLIVYFKNLTRLKRSELEYFWSSCRDSYLKTRRPRWISPQKLLEKQIKTYGVPSSRPSLRYAIILNAILENTEKKVLKYLISHGTRKLDEIVNALSLPVEEVKNAVDFITSLNLIKRSRDAKFRIGRKMIVSSLFIDFSKLGVSEEQIETSAATILSERRGELLDNFNVLRQWEKYSAHLKDLFSKNFNDTLQRFWNTPDIEKRRIWRKIVLDVFGLKESSIRSVIRTNRMEVNFYVRDFSRQEMTRLTNLLLKERDRLVRNGTIYSRLVTSKRSVGERVWQELNNPKVSPIDYVINSIVSRYRHERNYVIKTLFEQLIKLRRDQLQTYPNHGERLLHNQGTVNYPWCIKGNQMTILLKSRFALGSTVQHRSPEESGRAFGTLFDVYSSNGRIQTKYKDDYMILFVPDGHWREEDLFHLAKTGIYVFLNLSDLDDFIRKIESTGAPG